MDLVSIWWVQRGDKAGQHRCWVLITLPEHCGMSRDITSVLTNTSIQLGWLFLLQKYQKEGEPS